MRNGLALSDTFTLLILTIHSVLSSIDPRRWPHTHHVHLVEAGGAEERRTLAFCDYLRDHPDVAREYEDLKRDLAEKLAATDSESREGYSKNGFH